MPVHMNERNRMFVSHRCWPAARLAWLAQVEEILRAAQNQLDSVPAAHWLAGHWQFIDAVKCFVVNVYVIECAWVWV